MPFQVSPGVNVSEIDLTTIIPAVSTSVGAAVLPSITGPKEEVTTVTSEDELVRYFGKPTANNAEYWFPIANFLGYGNHVKVVGISQTGERNASSNATATTFTIKNQQDFDDGLPANDEATFGTFSSRYVGKEGSSIRVSIIDSDTAWANASSGLTALVNPDASTDTSPNSYFDTAPGTSTWAAQYGMSTLEDELHVLIEDADGLITGRAGTVLERYGYLSKSPGSLADTGAGNYWRDVINQQSKYVFVNDGVVYQDEIPLDYGVAGGWGAGYANVGNWNTVAEDPSIGGSPGANSYGVHAAQRTAENAAYHTHDTTLQYRLSGGLDGTSEFSAGVTAANKVTAWDKFKDTDTLDVSLLITGPADATTAKHVIENVAEFRKDCVAFISPLKSDVTGAAVSSDSNALTAVVGFRTDDLTIDSSYAVLDSGWKYQFDKYNNNYRWIPLNGDIAGLCARTDALRDAWWSPAGYNRGQIKNVVRLAWNPKQGHRDDLYRNGVNPVVTFPGQGTILFGDKTLQSKPSAFDRINVRRLFIVLEKAIATASKFSLFEFNDEFTRAQFRNMVEPFLRDVQGRRGIHEFKVVCDETNNTPEVIDRNEFIGDIYVKPARSINFIQLNFVAVRTGVDFSEIVGQF